MSARIYSALLTLYPDDLRNEFGEEMKQVFLEDLEDSRRSFGRRGVVRVWWRSVKELFRIALRIEISKREIAVPLIMFVLQELYVGGIMLMAHNDPLAVMPKSPGDMISLAIPIGLIPSAIAFIALRVGDRSVPVPLALSRIGLTAK